MTLKAIRLLFILLCFSIISAFYSGCNYITHRTISKDYAFDSTKSDQDPNYNVSLDFNYQDFTSYLYLGNRVENFTAYFNTFFKSQEDFNDAYDEYRASLFSYYNRRLDSLGITHDVPSSVKDKLTSAIERSSKIIQFHKNSKFIDDAVLIIGKSYFYLNEYYKAERTFNEFLSKFSSSVLADEAILYLGRTKVKLDKIDEGLTIFKTLVSTSPDNEIQSQASRELGILAYNSNNQDDAVKYFKASIDFSKDKERKAEGQFILAKILSGYKPTLAADEYKKVLDYSSDYDLTFFARLNYAKGLIKNKDFKKATDELTSLRKKYRDESGFTQLVDLEIANNLYGQKNYKDAKEKYYEVIVKYPNSISSSDAYFHLARHEEEINKDYLNAFINYKKATEESNSSDYFKESSLKSVTFEKYFGLLGDVSDSAKLNIPTANADVEKFRKKYNEDKGIEQQKELDRNGNTQTGTENPPKGDDGKQKGKGNGKSSTVGFKNKVYKVLPDTLKEDKKNNPPIDPGNQTRHPRNPLRNTEKKQDSTKDKHKDTLEVKVNDSLKVQTDSINAKTKSEKIFNAYYELAELFMYNLDQKDSAEFYLKRLLEKYPDSERQAKLLYTLGNFYKNGNKTSDAEQTFRKIISNYPNSVYAFESKKILGIKSSEVDITLNPVDAIIKEALAFFNDKKYPEAVMKLKEIESEYPDDSLLGKSFYTIGWIYENKIINKDSSLYYYKKLKEKFPHSEYSQKVTPMLDYLASLEIKNSTDSTNENFVRNDSSKVNSSPIDSTKVKNSDIPPVSDQKEHEAKIGKDSLDEKKVDTTNVSDQNKLSQEEINKLLKEPDPGKK